MKITTHVIMPIVELTNTVLMLCEVVLQYRL